MPTTLPVKDGFVFKEWFGFQSGPITDNVAYYAVFVEGQTTTNNDGTITTVIEDQGTVTTTTYATSNTA